MISNKPDFIEGDAIDEALACALHVRAQFDQLSVLELFQRSEGTLCLLTDEPVKPIQVREVANSVANDLPAGCAQMGTASEYCLIRLYEP